MTDVLNYLKQTKNTLIGNPNAKLELHRARELDGPLSATIVNYVNLSARSHASVADSSCSEETTTQIRIEAANVIASLAHGPREVLRGLLEANVPSAVLNALADFTPYDPDTLKVAVVRAIRALSVAIADCTGPSLWGLGEECLDLRSDARSVLDCLFQPEALDVYLPLLEDASLQIQLTIAQLLAFAIRVRKHRDSVTDWLPQDDRDKVAKGKRGWEVAALVNVNSPSRQGGWVVRHLTEMLKFRDFRSQEASLYAIGALVKENETIARVLSKPPPEGKAQSLLSVVSAFTKDRKSEVRLAACLCASNILRAASPSSNRQLACTILHVLSSTIASPMESTINRMKACHILSALVIDDNDRCIDAWKSGALVKIADLIKSITPSIKPQEWEDGEAIDIAHLREAALNAVGALALLDDDIRNEVSGALSLLPFISVSLSHPYAGVRYGACLCVRALARSVRVLRTSLLDSGIGLIICEIVEKGDEDKRVTNIALAGMCNLLNDFSPLRKTIMDRGIVTRIAALSKAQEDALRISALWAIKNLLNKAIATEKSSIMKQVGWDHLRLCLADSNPDVQEQALNILANIATAAENHIDMVFEQFSGEELMNILADALESPNEEVHCQAAYVLANIANGRDVHRTYLLSSMRILSALRSSMTHTRPEVRRATVSCIEQLAHTRPRQLHEAGVVDTLRNISRDSGSLSGLGAALSGSAGRMGGVSVEGLQEIRDAARSALRYMENDDFQM